jgi:hypothetical protein
MATNTLPSNSATYGISRSPCVCCTALHHGSKLDSAMEYSKRPYAYINVPLDTASAGKASQPAHFEDSPNPCTKPGTNATSSVDSALGPGAKEAPKVTNAIAKQNRVTAVFRMDLDTVLRGCIDTNEREPTKVSKKEKKK